MGMTYAFPGLGGRATKFLGEVASAGREMAPLLSWHVLVWVRDHCTRQVSWPHPLVDKALWSGVLPGQHNRALVVVVVGTGELWAGYLSFHPGPGPGL